MDYSSLRIGLYLWSAYIVELSQKACIALGQESERIRLYACLTGSPCIIIIAGAVSSLFSRVRLDESERRMRSSGVGGDPEMI